MFTPWIRRATTTSWKNGSILLLLAVQADDSHGAEVWATLYPSLNKKMNSLHSDCLSSDFLRGAQFFFCMCRVVRKTVTGQPVWITSEMCLPHWLIEPITVLNFVSVGEVWSVSDHWQICFCQWLKQVDYWCSHSSEIRPPPAHFLSAEPQSGTETCKLFPQICNTINTRWQWQN